MNSSGAVGNILVFTFVNLRDNTVYTENRKNSSSSSSSSTSVINTASPLRQDYNHPSHMFNIIAKD